MEPLAVLRAKIEGTRSAVKMAGYLEKRGKLKLVGSWKKYWFVLEGQLLLYYKSQLEYENLSACRGSLNVGLASCVRPGHGHTLQVITRTQCLTLRTKERALQEQWLQALLDSMALPSVASLKRQSATGTQHFRYSLDNLPAITETDDERAASKDETTEKECKTATLPRQVERQDSVLSRIKRLGGVSYGAKIDKHSALLHKSPSTPIVETKTELLEAKRMDRKSQEERRNSKGAAGGSSEEVVVAAKTPGLAKENGEGVVVLDGEEKKTERGSRVKSAEEKRGSVISINEYSEITTDNLCGGACDIKSDLNSEQAEDSDEYAEIDVKDINANSNLEMTDNNGNDLVATNDYNEIIINISSKDSLVNIALTDENQNTEGVLKIDQGCEEMTNNAEYSSATGGGTNGIKQNDGTEDEEEYYSSYDCVALMKDLVAIANNDEVEPGLPPRPEVKESTYEECLYEDLDLSGNQDTTKGKKKSNFRDKILLKDFRQHRQLKKTASNEQKSTKENTKDKKIEKGKENGQDTAIYEKVKDSAVEPKVKGKHSFLKKFVIKRKKKEVPSTGPAEEDEDDPMYDECLFGATPPEDPSPREDQLEEEEHGQQLTAGAVAELKDRLKMRTEDDSDEDSADYDTIGSSTTDEQQPSLTDKSDETKTKESMENLYTKTYKSQQVGMLQMLDTPSLPPRRGLRPVSPWHDIPTNNAPAYEEDHGVDTLVSGHKQSKDILSGPLVSDDVLNTPEGFIMIKNKFRQVEKGRKWNPEQQQVSFPKKSISEGEVSIQISKDSAQSDSSLGNERSSMEITVNDDFDSLEKSNVDGLDMEVSSIMDPPVELRKEVATAELVDLSGTAVEVEVNRFSNELHILLAQLAEITSAPLFHIGASKSLLGPPTYLSTLDQELGPIRRRRHSDPDYDVPRPHSFAQLRFQAESSSSDTSISPDSLEPPMVPIS